MNIETLTKAEQCADLLVADLQEAMTQNSAVASLLILPMVQRAAALKNDIAALRQAAGIDAAESVVSTAASTKPITRKLIDLPRGSLFRYRGSPGVYVLLDISDNGLVGDAPSKNGERKFQGLYSATETRAEFESIEVEFLPVSIDQEGGAA